MGAPASARLSPLRLFLDVQFCTLPDGDESAIMGGMSAWHNLRVEVQGDDEDALRRACSVHAADVVVRKTAKGLLASGEIQRVGRPEETIGAIGASVRTSFPDGELYVCIYPPVTKLLSAKVTTDGKLIELHPKP